MILVIFTVYCMATLVNSDLFLFPPEDNSVEFNDMNFDDMWRKHSSPKMLLSLSGILHYYRSFASSLVVYLFLSGN